MIVDFGWVLFRAEGLTAAKNYMFSMLGIANVTEPIYKLGWYLDKWTVFILTIAVILALDIPNRIGVLINKKRKINNNVLQIIRYVGLLLIFWISIMQVVSGTYNPFIYFRF